MAEDREELRKIYSRSEGEDAAHFIPAKDKVNIYDQDRPLRVCAYCRVSTDSEDQLSSYELQKKHYKTFVAEHPNWIMNEETDIFADEGISGTSRKHRDNFNIMIEKCRRGEYDLILTKSVSRFARNLVDCISLARQLKVQNPPVGVYFETDKLYTLSEESELKLSIFATFAQEESVKKSESMNWSLKERFKHGKLLTPELYGYRRPRDAGGNYIKYARLEIDESEATVVRFIYDAFLAGIGIDQIAETLNDMGIPTKTGGRWNDGGIRYILQNERYCGSVLTWKTFTADVFEHKKRKNREDKDQYLYRNHHPEIVSVEKFEAVQGLIQDRKHGLRGGLHVMQVIGNGIFQGYVPINHHWVNEDPEKYYQASDSVQEERSDVKVKRSLVSQFDLTGYQVVRTPFLTARSELPCVTFGQDKILFNTPCCRKLCGFDYFQILLHPYERKVAIRPCGQFDSFAIPWNRNGGARQLLVKNLSCPHFLRTLGQIMNWHPDYSYRVTGTWIEQGDERIMTFNLSKAAPVVRIMPEGGGGRAKRVFACPAEWEDTFGDEFYEFSLDNMLFYTTNTGDWNSREQSRAVDGMEQLSLLTPDQVLETIKSTRTGETNDD